MPGPPDTAKIAAARLWASNQLPYLASALFATTPRSAPGSGTVSVDAAWRVHLDPEIVDALDVADLGRVLLHLCTHLVRDHAARADAINVRPDDRIRWNRSADAEINDDLAAARLLPPIADDLPRDLGQAAGGLAEAYFAATVGEDATPGAGPRCGAGAGGSPVIDPDPHAPPGLGSAEADRVRQSVAADILAEHRTKPGSIPAGWVRWADARIPSTVDWRRALAAEIRRAVAATAGAVDYTYRRPARRGFGTVIPRAVLPALYRPVPSVAVVCDTSGSMSRSQLDVALSEIDAILRQAGLRSARMPVLAVDTEVHAVRRVSTADQVSLVGGGGTDMAAGITAAVRLRPRPDVIIVLTDGYTPWPDAGPTGTRVVVGLIRDDHLPSADDVPVWARCVVIDGLTAAG